MKSILKKLFLLVTLLLFAFCVQASILDNKSKIEDEPYGTRRVYKFTEQDQTIYLFDSETNTILFTTSNDRESIFIINENQKVTWFSENENLKKLIDNSFVDNESYKRKYINEGIRRILIDYHVQVIMAVLVFGMIALFRLYFQDAFYTFLVPFNAYSKTIEKIAQTDRQSLVVAVLFLVFLLLAFLLLIYSEIDFNVILWDFGVVLVALFLKWFVLNRVNVIFGNSSFSRFHLLEFLRYSIFLFLMVYLVSLVITLNHLSFDFVYEILLFPYLIIWFIRLFIIYYKRYNHNFLYFFSYLCATEVVPILFTVFFWRVK